VDVGSVIGRIGLWGQRTEWRRSLHYIISQLRGVEQFYDWNSVSMKGRFSYDGSLFLEGAMTNGANRVRGNNGSSTVEKGGRGDET